MSKIISRVGSSHFFQAIALNPLFPGSLAPHDFCPGRSHELQHTLFGSKLVEKLVGSSPSLDIFVSGWFLNIKQADLSVYLSSSSDNQGKEAASSNTGFVMWLRFTKIHFHRPCFLAEPVLRSQPYCDTV